MPGIIDQNILSEIPIPLSPASKGKRALRCPLDFAANSTWTFNLLIQQWQDVISAVTCLYVDNHDNDTDVVIDVNITQQRIIAPAGTQGYYAVLVPSTFAFTISSTGSTATVNLYILNFTPSNNVWGGPGVTPPSVQDVRIVSPIPLPVEVTNTVDVNVSGTVVVSGTVDVSNFPVTQNVDITSSISLTTIPTQTNSGDIQKPWYVGNKAITSGLLTQGSNAIVTGSNYYIITGYSFSIDLSTTNSSGSSITIELVDSVDGIIAEIIPKIPTTASAPQFASLLNVPNPPGYFYHSSSSGSVLTFEVAGGATLAGLFVVTVNYALTNIPG